MNNMLKYIAAIGLTLMLASCTRDFAPGRPADGADQNGVEITLAFPEINSAGTRAIGKNVPQLTDLDIFLFVFDGNDLLQTIQIPPTDTDWSSETDNRIKFKAYLPQTDNNATIHIIAVDDHTDSDKGSFARQIDEVGYGLEDYVMPSYTVRGDKDIYWQRIELGCPIVVPVDNKDNALDNIEGTEQQVKDKFKNPIPLIRNFAKVSLSVKDGIGFTLLGWTVVNDLDSSSVVPWHPKSNTSEVDFPVYAEYDESQSKIVSKSYWDLVKAGYTGVSLAGAQLRNTIDEIGEDNNTWGTEDKYIYERRKSSVDPLFILVHGQRDGRRAGYYKLALGYRDAGTGTDKDTGLFTEYNVLRNIGYSINITAVTDDGYESPEEAASGPAFNNVSGDVSTRNLTQISDGEDVLYVNQVSFVITTPEQAKDIEFRYQYKYNLSNGGGKLDNDRVRYNSTAYSSGLVAGDVIQSVTGPAPDGDWYKCLITAHEPTDELKIQTFTIYAPPRDSGTNDNGSLGLSRTISLVLRKPWDFMRMETFPGLIDDDKAWPDYDPDDTPSDPDVNYYVGSQKGAPLTVFWELPAGLPEAIFPLNFTIESDRQNIENAGVGNAVVQTAPSLFEGVNDHRISFVKTVTWQEYAPNGETSTAASRIIRARFVTTTELAYLTDDAIITTLRLHNPYFNIVYDKFERNLNMFELDDPNAKMPNDMIWDLSEDKENQIWSTFLESIKDGVRYRWTKEIDGLTIYQEENGNTAPAIGRRITSGNETDSEGNIIRYIVTRNDGDTFKFSVTFPAKSAAHKAMLIVTASENDGNGTHNVNIKESHTPSDLTVMQSDNDEFTTKRTRTYEYVIPAGSTTLQVTLSPENDYTNNALRIYKIEFYPLGEPQTTDDSGDSAGN